MTIISRLWSIMILKMLVLQLPRILILFTITKVIEKGIIEVTRGKNIRFSYQYYFNRCICYQITNIQIKTNYKFFNIIYRSLPKKKKNPHLNNTPLARLSPSSEMSHNTPRILTLKDLSGKPLPMSSLLTEQSERSLNSPVSHVSSAGSRHR